MFTRVSSQSLVRKALWAVIPVISSPEQSVPERNKGGGVQGTDENEQQKVKTHHDGKVVSEEPRAAAGMPDEEKHRRAE